MAIIFDILCLLFIAGLDTCMICYEMLTHFKNHMQCQCMPSRRPDVRCQEKSLEATRPLDLIQHFYSSLRIFCEA
jgi:hypothetical protein